jgi:hypothetical protein
MVFIFALILLMSLALYGFLAPIRSAEGITSQAAMKAILRRSVLLYAALACASPVLFEVYATMRLASGRSMALGQEFWPVYLMLSGGVLNLSIYAWMLLRLRGSQAPAWSFGRATIGLAVSLYVLAVFVDHATFYFQRSDDTGIVDLDALRDIHPIKDMACSAPTAVIRLEHGQPDAVATYRCPTTLLVGRYTNSPMLPWPSYTQGTSVDLAKAINDLRRGAER